ncbi:MAG: STAS domain-containing protein [Planctomycetota bacterium]
MDIREEQHGAVTVLSPLGPLVQHDAAVFATRVAERSAALLGRIVVDAAHVAYLDSKGIEALIDTADALARAGRTLRAVNVNHTVREALQITGNADAVEHYADLNAAVRSFA